MKAIFFPVGIILSFLCLAACQTTRICGTYSYSYNTGTPDKFALKINQDGSFEYFIFTDLFGHEKFQGSWLNNSDTLLLKFISPKIDGLMKNDTIIEISNDNNLIGKRSIVVIAQDSTRLVGAELLINDNEEPFITDENGEALIPLEIEIKNIKLNYFIYSKVRDYSVNRLESNKVVLIIYDKNKVPFIYSMPFHSWIIRKNKIIPLINGLQEKSNAYIKIKNQ
jgi:hypothetical protein